MSEKSNLYSPPKQVGQQGAAKSRALVVNIQDPLKQGRVQIRVVGHMDDLQAIPDEKLPWVKISNPTNAASLQTATTTPAFLPGSMVSVDQMGKQDWMITGGIPNDREDGNQTTHPAVHGKGQTDSINPASSGSTAQGGDGTFGWSMPLDQLGSVKSTLEAMKIRDETNRKAKRSAEPVEEAKSKSPVPKHYGNRKTQKDGQGGSIGASKFPNAKNAQKFIKQAIGNKSAIMQSALASMESLKKVTGNPTSIQAIGAGNFAGMLQNLAQRFGGGGGEKNEEDALPFDCAALKLLPPEKLTPELKFNLDRCLLIEQAVLNGDDDKIDLTQPEPNTPPGFEEPTS